VIEGAITPDEIERFNRMVNKTDGCWLWTGAPDPSGYGVFSFRGRAIRAHRFAYAAAHGAFDVKLDVAHECGDGNRLCVRPDHLCPRTRVANMAHPETKARMTAAHKGNRNRAILTSEEEQHYAARMAAGETAADCARQRNVSAGVMERLRRRSVATDG